MEQGGTRLRRGARGAAAAAAAFCLLVAGTGARRGEVRPTSIAIQPLVDPAPVRRGETDGFRTHPLEDGAPLVAHLVLSVTPGMDVRWRPVDPGGAVVLSLTPPKDVPPASQEPPDPDDPRSPHAAVRAARAMLESLPRTWRKRSMKRMKTLGIQEIPEFRAGLMVDALAQRAAGDPVGAAALLERAIWKGGPPVLDYLLAASRLEAGDMEGAASAVAAAGDLLGTLPGPMISIGGAILDAAEGRRHRALGRLTSVVEGQPALEEAFLLRALLSRQWCDLYDHSQIVADLEDALRSSPCCPQCALNLAEMIVFTGRPATAPIVIRPEAGCRNDALDFARERALALSFAAEGSMEEAMEAASRAQARDVSALRRGLAPAFMLAGDFAHLEEAYDPEADLLLEGAELVEHHLYSGLNAFWRGRPSRAAELFERAEERQVHLMGVDADQTGLLQWIRTLQVRAYLAAGRVQEARRAADRAREPGRGNLNGLLIYSTAATDLAAGDKEAAVVMTRRLTLAGLKFWRYLLDAEIALQEGNSAGAQSALSLASQGIDVQTTICPGILVEPYMLQAQGRALLALGRPGPAASVLQRVVTAGSRGLLAPDIVVPTWGILARAREEQGDAAGAAAAWSQIVGFWGNGETIPLVAEARRALDRLQGSGL